MAGGTPNYNKPIFATTPIIVAKVTNVGAVTNINDSISSGLVEIVHTVSDSFAIRAERLTVTFGTSIGSTNTAQLLFVVLYDPINGQYTIYKTQVVPSITVGDTQAPFSVIFDLSDLILPTDAKIGLARTQNAGADDNIHYIFEAASLTTV